MFQINEKVYIIECGKYIPALFKGYINDRLCYVKPKALFVRGGYGTTITCHLNNITKTPNLRL